MVNGKSFADVGGLWGTVNETVCLASKSGAKNVTMIDVQPANSIYWPAFRERCKEFGVKEYNEIIADLCDNNNVTLIKKFDIVHCSGILYHVSDPICFIRNIALLSKEYFIIGSMLIPEKIETKKGTLHTPVGTSHCVPLLDKKTKDILIEHFNSLNVKVGGINAPKPEFISQIDFKIRTGPWWYLFTAETMKNMVELFGFEVLDSSISNQGAQNLLCKIKK